MNTEIAGFYKSRFRRLSLGTILVASALAFITSTALEIPTANGQTVLAQFPFQSVDLLPALNEPYEFAAASSNDCIEVINTTTLGVAATIALPGTPNLMSLSPNGQTLYVADSTNDSIDVVNTQSLTLTDSIPLATSPVDVAVGLNNTLYVLDGNPSGFSRIQQINATTGLSVGPDLPNGGNIIYYGNLQISPDLQTLYYVNALQGATIYAFNVSTDSPTLLRTAHPDESSRIVISPDGSTIIQPDPDVGVNIYRASDFTLLGTLQTDSFSDAATFSPDGNIAYAAMGAYPSQIALYNTTDFQQLDGQIGLDSLDSVGTIATDSTGDELYVGFDGVYGKQGTWVYGTTNLVPEPASLGLLIGGIVIMKRRFRGGGDVSPGVTD